MIRNFEYRHNLVVKSNTLIRDVQSELSVQEQHLLAYIFSFIELNDSEFKPFELSPHQYCEVRGISCKGANYSNIKKTIQELADKSWWLRTDDDIHECMLFRWISDASLLKNGNIEIKLHPSLKPYLLELKGNYTKYSLDNILLLRRKYSIRLYEILSSYKWVTGCSIDVKSLRKMIGCNNKIPFKKFNSSIIKPAIEEINLFTDIHVDYEVIYEGKIADTIKFKLTGIDDYLESNTEETDAWINRRRNRFNSQAEIHR